MRRNFRRSILVAIFASVALMASFAQADHHGGGGGGGGHMGGHGFSGGHGFGGGPSHVSFGHSGGHGVDGHWGGSHFDWGHHYNYHPYYYGYRPYLSFYWPYAFSYYTYPYFYSYGYPGDYYGYPAYGYGYQTYYYSEPNEYYASSGDFDYGNSAAPREYVVSRPVLEVARMEVRLPDPDAMIVVDGKQMGGTGAVRQFKSPPIDPSQQYTYTVKAEWNANGKLVSEERRVQVQANNLSVVDFTKPSQAGPNLGPVVPELPPPQQP